MANIETEDEPADESNDFSLSKFMSSVLIQSQTNYINLYLLSIFSQICRAKLILFSSSTVPTMSS